MSDINIVLENRDDIHVAVEEKDINVEVPAGKDGRALHPRGEWSASAAYAYLDLVSYEGSSYVATKAVPAGTLPTDTSYWMLSAEKGEPGTPEWGAITGDLSDQTDLQEALDDKAPVILNSASGSIASFTDGSPAPVTALSVSIEPVQAGTGDPSPENVRPISGWDEATVTRTGKNLIDAVHVPLLNGYINGGSKIVESSPDKTIYFPVKLNTIYTVSFTQVAKSTSAANDDFQLGLFSSEPANNSVGVRLVNRQRASATANYNFTYTFNSENYPWVGVKICNTQRSDLSATLATFQLELGSSATSFEPYQAQQVTIDLDGTRYGGVLNVLTGEMVVTKVEFDATSDLTYGTSSQGTNCNVFQIALTSNNLPSSVAYTAISNRFSKNIPSDTPGRMVHSGNTIYFVISKSEVEYTVASLKTWLDNHPTQFVYTLATPQTVQLTPSQLSTLLGQNNIWSDTGNSTVTYRADTKLYIDGKFSQLQALILEN